MVLLKCAILGYLLGNINPSYLLGRLRGIDIRKRGSGNAGASNAVITMSLGAGVFAAVFDIAKASVAYVLAGTLFPELSYAGILSASACTAGHIFPAAMGFRGGKGLACFGGTVLAFSPVVFAVMLAAETAAALAADYICVIPLTAPVLFTAFYAFTTGCASGTALLAAVSVIMTLKHIPNLIRISSSTEVHLSFLWHRERELERIIGDTDRIQKNNGKSSRNTP